VTGDRPSAFAPAFPGCFSFISAIFLQFTIQGVYLQLVFRSGLPLILDIINAILCIIKAGEMLSRPSIFGPDFALDTGQSVAAAGHLLDKGAKKHGF